MNESYTPNSPEDQLPQEVVAALRERHGPDIPVPETVDATVLANAKLHLDTISRPVPAKSGTRRFVWVAWSTGTLAAAMLLFAVLPRTPDQARELPAVMAPEAAKTQSVANADDIDGNGTVDILDAFALARTVQSGDADLSRWDQNGDGRTDQDDVKLVALHAVML